MNEQTEQAEQTKQQTASSGENLINATGEPSKSSKGRIWKIICWILVIAYSLFFILLVFLFVCNKLDNITLLLNVTGLLFITLGSLLSMLRSWAIELQQGPKRFIGNGGMIFSIILVIGGYVSALFGLILA